MKFLCEYAKHNFKVNEPGLDNIFRELLVGHFHKNTLTVDALKIMNESVSIENTIKGLGSNISTIQDHRKIANKLENDTLEKYRPILINILKEIVNAVKEKYKLDLTDIFRENNEDYGYEIELDDTHISAEEYAKWISFVGIRIDRNNNFYFDVNYSDGNNDWDDSIHERYLRLFDLVNVVNYCLNIPKIITALNIDVLNKINEGRHHQHDEIDPGTIGKMVKGMGNKIQTYNDYLKDTNKARNSLEKEYRSTVVNMLEQVVINIKEKYNQTLEQIFEEEYGEMYYSDYDMFLDNSVADDTGIDYVYFRNLQMDGDDLHVEIVVGGDYNTWDKVVPSSYVPFDDLLMILNMCIDVPKITSALTIDALKIVNESMGILYGGNIARSIPDLGAKIQNYNTFLSKSVKMGEDISRKYEPILLNMIKQIIIVLKKEYNQTLREVLEEYDEDYSHEMYLSYDLVEYEEYASYALFLTIELEDNGDMLAQIIYGSPDDSWDHQMDAKHLYLSDLMMIVNYCLNIPKIKSALTIDALKIMNEDKHFIESKLI